MLVNYICLQQIMLSKVIRKYKKKLRRFNTLELSISLLFEFRCYIII